MILKTLLVLVGILSVLAGGLAALLKKKTAKGEKLEESLKMATETIKIRDDIQEQSEENVQQYIETVDTLEDIDEEVEESVNAITDDDMSMLSFLRNGT